MYSPSKMSVSRTCAFFPLSLLRSVIYHFFKRESFLLPLILWEESFKALSFSFSAWVFTSAFFLSSIAHVAFLSVLPWLSLSTVRKRAQLASRLFHIARLPHSIEQCSASLSNLMPGICVLNRAFWAWCLRVVLWRDFIHLPRNHRGFIYLQLAYPLLLCWVIGMESCILNLIVAERPRWSGFGKLWFGQASWILLLLDIFIQSTHWTKG